MNKRAHDNDNNNNDFFKKKFKTTNYYNLELYELENIGNSIGIPKYENKSQYHNKIEQFYLLQDQIRKEKETKENINQFNSGQSLPIKLTINCTSGSFEKTFWNVFRNKYLFNEIFSNFIFNKIYQYDQLVYVPNIINRFSNGEFIIKDKVRIGSYLAFDSQLNDYDNNGIQQIYQLIIKDNKENREFYEKLFRNYRNHFEINCIGGIQIHQQISLMIKSNNSMVIEQFKLVSGLSKNQIKEILISIFKREKEDGEKFIVNSFKRFKMFIYLQINYQLPDENFEFQEFDIGFKNDSPMFFKKFCKLLSMIKSNQYFNQFCIDTQFNESLNDLEQFKQQFTIQQQSITIKELLIDLSINSNQISNIYLKNSIEKYIRVYYQLFNKKFQDNFLFFNNDNSSNNVNSLNNIKLDQLILNFKYFSNKFNQGITSKRKEENYLLFLINKINLLNLIQKNNFNQLLLFELIKIEMIDLIDYFLKTSNCFVQLFLIENDKFKFKFFQSIKSIEILNYFFNNDQFKELIFSNLNYYWQFIPNFEILKEFELKMMQLNRKFLVNECINKLHLDGIVLEYLLRGIQLPEIYQVHKDISFNSYCYLNNKAMNDGKHEIILQLFNSGILKKVDLSNIFFKYMGKLNCLYSRVYFAKWVFNNCINSIQLNLVNPYQTLELSIRIINHYYGKDNNHRFNEEDNEPTTIIIEMSSVDIILLLSYCGELKKCYELIDDIDPNFTKIIDHQDYRRNDQALNLFLNYFFKNFYNNSRSNFLNNEVLSAFKHQLFNVLYNIISFGNIEALKFIILNYSFVLSTNKTNGFEPFLSENHLLELLKKLISNCFIECIPLLLNFIKIDDAKYNSIKNSIIGKDKRISTSLGFRHFKKLIKN